MRLHASLGSYPSCAPLDPWLYQTVQIPTEIYSITTITVEGYRAIGGSLADCSEYNSTDADEELYVQLRDDSGTPLTKAGGMASDAIPTGGLCIGKHLAKAVKLPPEAQPAAEGQGADLPTGATAPLAATTVYNFAGVTRASCDAGGICAHESDVDRFPYRRARHRNDFEQPTNTAYGYISVDNNSYWRTDDPGSRDEIFVQFDMVINEDIADITQIDFTFKGYTQGGTTEHRIYVLRTGADPFVEASWVQVGTGQSIPTAKTTMVRSLTANFADYIDPATGAITWGVYETRSSQRMRVYYVEMAVTYNSPPDAPINLLCEGLINPTGVTDTLPEFSWTFSDPDTGDTQSAYQIQVGTDMDWGNGAEMWDSGKVSSAASTVEYGAAPLPLDGTTYYWRVRTWDDNDRDGAWSATQQFVMGNRPPDAPTDLLCEGLVNPTSVADTLPEFSWTFSDPDTGDTQSAYQIQVGSDTDWSSAEMWDPGWVSDTASLVEYGAAALPLDGTTYYWRIRTRDDEGATGPWSDTQQFTMNAPPNAPTDPLCEGLVNPTGVADTLPEFSWTFSDPDAGDTQGAYQIQVGTDADWSSAEMWDSGWVSDTASLVEYGAAALPLDGTTYYWRVRTRDEHGLTGDWVSTQQFTMDIPPNAPTNPLCEGLVNPTGVTDTLPEFSWTFSDPDAGDTQSAYQIQVGTDADWGNGAEMWDSGWVSSAASLVEYGAAALPLDGATYYWRVRTRDNHDAAGDWSSTQQFTMEFVPNTPPNAPTNLLCEGVVNPTDVTDTTPEFSWTFSDPDAGDTQGAYQIQVGTDTDWGNGAEMWDTGWVSGSAATAEYAGAALTRNGATYYWRIRTQDGDGAEGSWSDTQQFTMASKPVGFIEDGGAIPEVWEYFNVDFTEHVDLMSLAGQNVQVYFYTLHDDDEYGTWFYLDDVECNVCTEWPIPDPESGTASIGGVVRVGFSPMTGVEVAAYSQGGQLYRTTTIHDGSYHFYNIPPGTYHIYAEAWVSSSLLTASDTVTVVADERNYGVNLTLQ